MYPIYNKINKIYIYPNTLVYKLLRNVIKKYVKCM